MILLLIIALLITICVIINRIAIAAKKKRNDAFERYLSCVDNLFLEEIVHNKASYRFYKGKKGSKDILLAVYLYLGRYKFLVSMKSTGPVVDRFTQVTYIQFLTYLGYTIPEEVVNTSKVKNKIKKNIKPPIKDVIHL